MFDPQTRRGLPRSPWPTAVGVALVAAGLIYTGRGGFVAFEVMEIDLADVGTTFTVFIFLALLTERAVEVALEMRYGSEKMGIVAPVEEAVANDKVTADFMRRDLEMLSAPQDRLALVTDDFRATASQSRSAIATTVTEAERRLGDLRRQKLRSALLLSCVLGFVVSVTGFQLLHSVLDLNPENGAVPAHQQRLFRSVDIVLTAVVLAGGAGGVHRLLTDLLRLRGKTLQEIAAAPR